MQKNQILSDIFRPYLLNLNPSQKKLNYQINIRVYNNASNSDISLECKDYV